MTHPSRYVFAVGVAVVIWVVMGAVPSPAQDREEGTVRPPGTVTNLFETLDPDRRIDALRVELPEGWGLKDAKLLRYGTEPVPVRVQELGAAGRHLLSLDAPVRGPHDLVLRVRTPDLPGAHVWSLQALVRQPADTESVAQPQFRALETKTRRVAIEAASPPDRANRALSLAEAGAPLQLRASALPTLGQQSPFTIEFWVQTNGLDEVILSSWTGNEAMAYPAEFVVDRGGRLRFYSGRPGQHRALQTGRPIADGKWHHVALVHDARRSRLRLLFDGRPADSIRGQVPPAPGPMPLAIGGRLGHDERPRQERPPLFSGQIDELRIWAEARSIEAIRRLKGRPARGATAETGRTTLVRLGFDGEGAAPAEARMTDGWPEGARRVPTTLSFRPGLRNLRARTEGRSVTLQWAADASDIEHFVVDRATGKRPFTTIATLPPAEAEQSTLTTPPTFAYTDEQVAGQVVFYRIRLKQANGRARTSGTIKIGLGPASENGRPVKLIGNFPNPFSETTTVAYEVNESEPVTITVWDLQGHKIAQLADGRRDPGYHEVPFDATDLPSGNYFLRLETPSGKQSRKMVVLK